MFTNDEVIIFTKEYINNMYDCKLLSISHNTVYKIECPSPFILRITSSEHRTYNELISEIDFLLYLHINDADVACPIQAKDGQYVIKRQYFEKDIFLTAFTIAEGSEWFSRADDNAYLFNIGKTLGAIHRLSSLYVPGTVNKRRQYYESQHLAKATDVFARCNPQLVKLYEEFCQKLSSLTKSSATYGLTHGDFLFSNYGVDPNGKVVVFDFDECEYSWYLNDIAICAYYYLLGGAPTMVENKTDEAERLIYEFMKGYISEHNLPLTELIHLDLFFKMRDYILLSTIYETDESERSEWQNDVINTATERIFCDKPLVKIDIPLLITSRASRN